MKGMKIGRKQQKKSKNKEKIQDTEIQDKILWIKKMEEQDAHFKY